ncbi:MAG: hypothetical protein AAFV07_12395 [Bacteroidota bacterium]
MYRMYFFLFCLIGSAQAQPLFESEFSYSQSFGFRTGVPLPDGGWMMVANWQTFDSTGAMLVRLDSALQVAWSKRFRYLRRDDFGTITALSDGNFMVGGAMRQNFTLEEGGALYKVDIDGNLIWSKFYDGVFDDRVLAIFEQADSTLMVFVRYGVTNRATRILHLTADGDIISERHFHTDANNSYGVRAEGVTSNGRGKYFLSGRGFNADSSEFFLFVCALTDQGMEWYRQFDFERTVVSSNDLQFTDDHHIVISGNINDSVTNGTNTLLLKMDTLGNTIWAKEYGLPDQFGEFVGNIGLAADGDLLISGWANNAIFRDMYLAKITPNGIPQWVRTYPGQGLGPVIPRDNRLFLIASKNSNAYLLYTTADGESFCEDSLRSTLLEFPLEPSIIFLTPGEEAPGLTAMVPVTVITADSVMSSLACSGVLRINQLTPQPLRIYPNPATTNIDIVVRDMR